MCLLEHDTRLANPTNKRLSFVNILRTPFLELITPKARQNPNALGYDGLGYILPDAEALNAAYTENLLYALPSIKNVNDNSHHIQTFQCNNIDNGFHRVQQEAYHADCAPFFAGMID